MMEYSLTFFGIYLLCLFKFIAGPTLGSAAGYSILEIELVTVSGMMTSVFLIIFLGEWVKKTWIIKIKKNQKRFSKRSRNVVRVWQKFGIFGIATLTPVVFTPIGGAIIMTSFGIAKKKIIFSMLISAIFWAGVFGLTIKNILEIPFLNKLLP